MKPYLARTLSLVGILAFTLPPAVFAQDADSDFLSDAEELVIGTNPYDTDTDGDGLLDRAEVYPFQTVAGTFTYGAALADAASKGGRLVVIDSLDKLYRVKRGLLTAALPSPVPNNYDPVVSLATPFWSGGQDILNDGQYQWADYGSTLATPSNISELGSAVFGDLAPGSSTVSNVVNIAALTVGRPFVASGVPSGTTITAINSAARTLTLSQPVASILSQRISRVVLSNPGFGYTSPPVVSFTGASGISSVAVTAGGSSYTVAPTVSFVGGTGSGATAIATVSGGAVTGVTLTSRGSYTVVPTGVTFTPVGTGSGATATVSLGTGPTTDVVLTAEGRIQSITVTGDGSTFFTAAPAVTFSGGNGGGAVANAVLTLVANANLSAVAVTAAGTGYTTTPTVTISGGGGTGATATASINSSGQVTGISINNPGSAYTSAPTIAIVGVGTGATATASIRQFSARASSPVPGSYVNWLNDLLPGNRVNSQEGVFLSTGSVFTWETAQVTTTRGYLLERRPTNPTNPDTDADGLNDLVETNTGIFVSALNTGTNPLLADTDGDGLSDGVELALDSNPFLSDSDGSFLEKPRLEGELNVSIGQSYTPFGNRTDNNRFGDDGSALLMEVNGKLLWQNNVGDVREIPDTQFASPLMVSNTEAVIWMNAFDPARSTDPTNNPIKVGFYRLNADGTVGAPQILPLLGTDIIPTAPITTTTQAFSLVTTGNIGNGGTTPYPNQEADRLTPHFFIYRLTFDLQAQLLGQIEIENFDPKTTAGPAVRAVGHGSDGSLVFSVDYVPASTVISGNTYSGPISYSLRRLFWVNGSRPGYSGIWEELTCDGKTPAANYNIRPVRVLYTSQTRVVYQMLGAGGPIYDARRNSFTGYLSEDRLFPAATPTVAGIATGIVSYLNVSTQSKEGNRIWIYALGNDPITSSTPTLNKTVLACRLDEDSIDIIYSAKLSKSLDDSARVEKINPEDGSALITSDNIEELLWVHDKGAADVTKLTKVPNSRLARTLFVSGKELVLWNNALGPISGSGRLDPVQISHFKLSAAGIITNPVNGSTDLSPKVAGTFVLTTPPFTPGAAYWRFVTAEKSGTTNAIVRNYILLRGDAPADDDGDRLSNAEELAPDPLRPYPASITDIGDPDTDGDGILDGLEVHPFRIITGNFTFEAARLDAISRGGRLAVLDTAAKRSQIKKQLLNENSGRRLWLGGGDMEVGSESANSREGNYDWVDARGGFLNAAGVRSSVDFTTTNWAPGQPKNTGNTDGLQLEASYLWSLAPVSQQQGYVLENAATNPAIADTDGDGLNDGLELGAGTNPLLTDTDGDGLSDKVETNTGIFVSALNTGTNPAVADTDGDGLSDGAEVNGTGGFTSDPLLMDTDSDGVSDFVEVNALPPTNPRDPSSPNVPTIVGPNHNRPVTYRTAQTLTIPSSFSPFGQRPDTDKIGDDGSAAIRDRNGVIIWSDKSGNAVIIPNSSLARTLYVSNSECVIYANRFAADYDIWGSFSNMVIYRRDTNGTVTASPTIPVRGTVLDTCPVTPNSYGFTIVAAYGWNFSTTESRRTVQTGSNAAGPVYATSNVDQWHNINYEQYRITWDGALQSLRFTTVDVSQTNTNLGNTDVVGHGDDGSMIINTTIAANYIESDATGERFETQGATLWASWQINSERIARFTAASGGDVREAVYVSNSRVLLENEGDDGAGWISDFRMRANGILDFVGREDLALGESVLPISGYTRSGLPPFVYTLDDATGKRLKLYRYDDTLETLGAALLPSRVIGGSSFVRNPRDASLLIKAEGAGGVLWIPTIPSPSGGVAGLGVAKRLDNSTFGLPMFVSATEAVAWMNNGVSVDLGAGGVLPLAQISHFTNTSTGITFTKSLTPPIGGRYVALPSPLTPDPDSEGWFVTTFEKISDRASRVLSYQLLEQDTDGDGLSDRLEESSGTDPLLTDTDGDGLSDGDEVNEGTDPLDEDTDNDGLSDGDEVALGTNPRVGDSDGDGRLDGAEVDVGTDPLEFDEPDTDGDGVSDTDETNLTQTDPDTASFGPGTATGSIPFSNSLVNGDYAGLVFDPKSGQSFKQNLRLSNKGSFSSSLLGLVGDTSLKGTFSTTGAFIGVPSATSGLISVRMNLVKQGVNNYYIEGNFKSRTGGTLYFQLRHTLYSKSNAYPSAGKVTFEAALPANVSGPAGSAVATGSISTSGQVAFKIYLPDGSSSSYSAPIVDGGLIPLFSRSSSKARTVLLGTLKLQDVPGQSDFDGSVRLFSATGATGSLFPSGFDQLRDLTGSRYYPPIKGTLPLSSFVPSANNAVFNWLGGNFDGVQKVGTWATNGQMTIPATQSDRSKATFSSSSGLLSLSHTRTDVPRSLSNASSNGYAVVVQKNSTFKGYYTSGLSADDFEVVANTSGLNPDITSVSPLNKSISAAETSYTVTVGTTGTWSVAIPPTANWVSVTVSSATGGTGSSFTTSGIGNGSVVIKVTTNVTNARREAEITIAGIKHKIQQEFR